MSDKWCPAGKIERWNGRGCVVDAAIERGFSDVALSDIEVCPWPSRQMPVRPYAEDCAAQEADRQPDALDARNAGYAAGRRAGIEECVEAVKPLVDQALVGMVDWCAEYADGECIWDRDNVTGDEVQSCRGCPMDELREIAASLEKLMGK